MSEIARTIDQVIEQGLAPALKGDGYRKDGRTFRRAETVGIRVVNVQASQWNAGDEGRFTLNLGIYFPEVVPFLAWMRATDRPGEADCVVRERIGFVLPARQDHWWLVTPATDRAALAQELREVWEQFASPWLDAHAHLHAARALALKKSTPYWAAAISLALGERDAARKDLDEALVAATGSENVTAQLREWGERHGILRETAV